VPINEDEALSESLSDERLEEVLVCEQVVVLPEPLFVVAQVCYLERHLVHVNRLRPPRLVLQQAVFEVQLASTLLRIVNVLYECTRLLH
jgi:hypothetical protein